jgi:hypothetical protein
LRRLRNLAPIRALLQRAKEQFMTKSQHDWKNPQHTENQNNAMSDDPGDGGRKSDVLGQANAPTPVEKAPEHDAQDQSTIEAFGEEGAGIAAKE